jgi:antitoxin YefM
MNILTFSEARASLKTVMDDVCKDHIPTVVTRVNGEHVVMLSLDDFNSMEETMHLLGSENNARRLRESIAQLKAGKAEIRELIRNDKPKKQKQAKS